MQYHAGVAHDWKKEGFKAASEARAELIKWMANHCKAQRTFHDVALFGMVRFIASRGTVRHGELPYIAKLYV